MAKNHMELKVKKDIFDRLAENMKDGKVEFRVLKPRQKDIFDRVELSDSDKEILKLKDEIPKLISEAVGKIKLPEKETVVKEVRVEVKEKEDKRELVEMSVVADLQKIIKELKKEIKELRSQVEDIPMPGGSGVIGIPPPEGHNDKVLVVNKNGAVWSNPTVIYFGDSWRIRVSGNDLVTENLQSGTWVEATGVTPP